MIFFFSLCFIIYDKEFKNGLSKFCGRQPLKYLLSPLLNTLSNLQLSNTLILYTCIFIIFMRAKYLYTYKIYEKFMTNTFIEYVKRNQIYHDAREKDAAIDEILTFSLHEINKSH